MIGNTVGNGIFVNELAEFRHSVFFAFHKRCSRKPDITGIWKYGTHLCCHRSVITAMTFIDKHKNISGIIFQSAYFYSVELVDNRRNHIDRIRIDKRDKVFSAGCACRFQPCMRKRLHDLPVQFLSVRYNNNARSPCKFHKNVFGKHHHRERLSAPLRMPDDAALPVAAAVVLVNGLDNLFHSKILLITANLFDICIVQHKKLRQLQQTLFGKQRYNCPILLCGHSADHAFFKCSI